MLRGEAPAAAAAAVGTSPAAPAAKAAAAVILAGLGDAAGSLADGVLLRRPVLPSRQSCGSV